MAYYEHEREERRPSLSRPFCSCLPAPSTELWGVVYRYLEKRGLSSSLAKWNGWYPSKNTTDTEPRIVIPATSADPTNFFWQARYLGEDAPASIKRYTSPYAPRGDAIVVVWPHDTTPPSRSVIVEGPMDALAAAGEGFLGIALLGNTPPEAVLDLVPKFAGLFTRTTPLLVFDEDAPKEAVSIVRRLSERGVVCTLRSPYPYKDVASIPKEERSRFLV
jgi:hypothetical protein